MVIKIRYENKALAGPALSMNIRQYSLHYFLNVCDAWDSFIDWSYSK